MKETLKNTLVNLTVNRKTNKSMACTSCAAKQQSISLVSSPRRTLAPQTIIEEDCHFSLQEVIDKKDYLISLKSQVPVKELKTLSYNIFKLNRTIKNYSENCNKYLSDLYDIFSRYPQ